MALRSQRQKMFVQEYLVDLNATQAAIRAGYAPKRADATAYNLLRNTEIQAAVEKAMKAREKRTEITQDRVLKEYARIAFFDPRKFFDENGNLIAVTELDDDTAAALAGIETIRRTMGKGEDAEPIEINKIKLPDKVKALQDLGKHLGLFEKDNDQRNQPQKIVITRRSRDD